MTELLLLRWQHQQLGEFPVPEGINPDKAETYCQYLINAFLGSVGFTEKIIPTRMLIDGAVIAAGLEIPAFLVNFASGKIQTTSLPPQAWQRLYSNCRVGQSKQELKLEQTEFNLQLGEQLNGNDSVIKRYDQYRLYKKLRKQLTDKREDKKRSHAQSIKIIESFMDEHKDQVAPPLYYLCQWAIEMYRNGSYTKARLAVSTVPKYLGQLQELVNFVGSEDLLTLDAEELLEIYQGLVNRSKTLKAKAYKAGRIKEFHHFLLKCGYSGRLNLNELEGVKAHGTAVDANYLNETAYQATLVELNRVDARHSRIVTIRRLITMLGYRCGLRRTEAWKLRLCDIQISHYPVLLIRASQYKTVKSPQSIRQLPLKSLLTQQELDEFLHWVEQRRLEQGLDDFATDSSFLFCHEHNGLSLIKEDLIFPVIQMVLRAVTGDDSIRYHHLRHSCGNNLMLRFQKITWSELALEKIEPVESETNNLFGLSDQYPSRKHLFQVSALLGHASPDITLRNYIHCCDYLLRHYLNQAHDDTLPVTSITAISGIGRESLYKSRQRKYPELSVLQIAKHQLREKTRLVKDENSAKQNEPIDWPEELLQLPQLHLLEEPPISIMHQLIENYDPEQKDARYWAGKTCYSEYQIQKWLDAALFLAHMKTGKGVPRHIRPQWWGLADAEQKNAILIQETRQQPRCMPKPHNQQDVKDAQLALQHLKTMRNSTPELTRWGIQYYLETNVSSHSHLRMKTLDDAKRFKDFILALGFTKKRIHCQLKPQTRPGSLPKHKQVEFWAKELSIQTNQITVRTPIEKRGSDFGSLSMLVVHENGHASYGIRYALYMTGILMLVANEISL
ncbi:tyrosine-type recombinase/integrase [methane-oxidizing endosymbiont of Gigantopelta aegis]|uniref:tyrosine-type recombinase/integrase n=1 Tax=methane-oxidizing endosymbiont of Gigantopelta aegis TaxID=2794938 RepID=UPI0018DC318C|nr:tyrosine-type recombinase/integrase [methane-oxidizing endosymbiont of Gigantopelta aegis]